MGGSARLEHQLRKDAAIAVAMQSRTKTSGQDHESRNFRQATAGSPGSSSAAVPSSTRPPQTAASSNSSSTVSPAPPPSGAGHGDGPAPTETKRFLLLCVDGPYHKRYSNIELPPNLDDRTLFEAIRRERTKLRKSYTRSFDHVSDPGLLQKALEKITLLGDRFWDVSQMFFIPRLADFVKVRAPNRKRGSRPISHLIAS